MTGEASATSPPKVQWCQRFDKLYLTIFIADSTDADFVVDWSEPKTFKCSTQGGDGQKYEVKLDLYGEIVQEGAKKRVTGRSISVVVMKSEESSGPYWPRLLADKKKPQWLSTDFNLWVDEDASDDEAAGDKGGDMSDIMSRMSDMGPGMGGMPGMMGGMPGMGDMDMGDLDGEPTEEDSDDDDLPDLET